MREYLIGYLLEALEPAEQQMVETELSRDPQLKRDLDILARSLNPLATDKGFFDPPPGLAQRTCEFVAIQSQSVLPASSGAPQGGRWRMADMFVAAGIFLAATLLFFPALERSRFAARVTGCQENMRQLGMALSQYSDLNRGFFPNVPAKGRSGVAGIYAARLNEQGFLPGPEVLICPGSPQAENLAEFRMPTFKELRVARPEEVAILQQKLGGSYGYNLGFVQHGEYRPTKNQGRKRFAILADAPISQAPYHSSNHDGRGQNVLFEDMHVQYMITCKPQECDDHIFTNDDGRVAAGLHEDDAVIAASQVKPVTDPGVLKNCREEVENE